MSEEELEKLREEAKEVLQPQESEEGSGEGEAQAQADYLEPIISVFRGVSQIIANALGDPTLVLTENEEAMLRAGLEPFANEINQHIETLKYLPLILFGVEYGQRVIASLRRKRENRDIGNEWHGKDHPNEVLNTKAPVSQGSGGQAGDSVEGANPT